MEPHLIPRRDRNEGVDLLRCTAGCAVNCCALISGCAGVTAHHRCRNISALWLRVAIYSVLIALLLFKALRIRLLLDKIPDGENSGE